VLREVIERWGVGQSEGGDVRVESTYVVRDGGEDFGEHEEVHEDKREPVVLGVVEREEEKSGDEDEEGDEGGTDFGSGESRANDTPSLGSEIKNTKECSFRKCK